MTQTVRSKPGVWNSLQRNSIIGFFINLESDRESSARNVLRYTLPKLKANIWRKKGARTAYIREVGVRVAGVAGRTFFMMSYKWRT